MCINSKRFVTRVTTIELQKQGKNRHAQHRAKPRPDDIKDEANGNKVPEYTTTRTAWQNVNRTGNIVPIRNEWDSSKSTNGEGNEHSNTFGAR
jgi:hypothetical protein